MSVLIEASSLKKSIMPTEYAPSGFLLLFFPYMAEYTFTGTAHFLSSSCLVNLFFKTEIYPNKTWWKVLRKI